MQIDSTLQKLEVHVVAAIAVVLVSGIAFVLCARFLQRTTVCRTSLRRSSRQATPRAASQETQPALLEPALRSLDGVAHHG